MSVATSPRAKSGVGAGKCLGACNSFQNLAARSTCSGLATSLLGTAHPSVRVNVAFASSASRRRRFDQHLPGRYHDKVISGTEAMKLAGISATEALGLRQISALGGG